MYRVKRLLLLMLCIVAPAQCGAAQSAENSASGPSQSEQLVDECLLVLIPPKVCRRIRRLFSLLRRQARSCSAVTRMVCSPLTERVSQLTETAVVPPAEMAGVSTSPRTAGRAPRWRGRSRFGVRCGRPIRWILGRGFEIVRCCTGVLMIEEAGGRASDYHGGSLDIFTPPILASNGLIHEQIMRVLAV